MASQAARATAAARRTPRHPQDWMRRRMLVAGDLVAIGVAVAAALIISGRSGAGDRILWGLLFAPVLIVIFKIYGLYDRDVKRISHSTVDDLPWLVHAVMVGSLGFWLYARYSPMQRLDFAEILGFGVLTIGAVVLARFLVRALSASIAGAEPALLVGRGRMADLLVSKLIAHPEYRLRVVGRLTRSGEPAATEDALPVLGAISALGDIAARERATRVLVAPGDIDGHELEALLRRCRELALKLTLVPQLSDVLGPAVEIDDVEGVTVLGVNPPWLPRSSRALKRGMDIVVSAVLLVLLAPVCAAIAIAIKFDSRGPVFFTQERVGRNSCRFRLFKFRTMVADAEQRHAALLEHSGDPHWLKLERDPRVTRVGRLLRRMSLDELPQLGNVLHGDMSLVGPRPLIVAEDELVEGWGRGRLDLTPGITGYWQVLGRTRIPFEEMVKLDYLYVMNWSLWSDVRLIIRTLPAIVAGRGAN
jgi:exopolysaccharide biosynthesis polyprenyl glycosylphosphotransferase